MTERMIREFAAEHRLTVLKRVTTGNERQGFATFELSGEPPAVLAAWKAFPRDHIRSAAFDRLDRVTNPEHPDRGQPFIRLESIWFSDGQ